MKSNTKIGLSFCLSSLIFCFFICVFFLQSVFGASEGGNTVTEETDVVMCGSLDGGTYYTFAYNNGITPTTPNLCINGTSVSNRLWNSAANVWTWECVGFGTTGPICTVNKSRCGDGQLGMGVGYTNQEKCDDENTNNNDKCNNNCQWNIPTCGSAKNKTYYAFGNNGSALTQISSNLCPLGESVVNRSWDPNSHTWSRRCVWEGVDLFAPKSEVCTAKEGRCGDGKIGTGIGYLNQEVCDDGNSNNNDSCNNSCQRNIPTCGLVNYKTHYAFGNNGTALTKNSKNICSLGQIATNRSWNSSNHSWTWKCVREGNNSGAPMSSLCYARESRCGDGLVGTGIGYINQEQCDDGNTNNDDICKNNCKFNIPTCGSANYKTYYAFGNNGSALTQISPNLCSPGESVVNRSWDSNSHTWSRRCVWEGAERFVPKSELCTAKESRCGDGVVGDGIGYTNQESCDGEGKAQCGWSELCNSVSCQCQIFEKGVCGDAAYRGFNSDEQVSDAGLCAPGSTLVSPISGKGPRVRECKGEDGFVENLDGTVSVVYGTITQCESYPLGKIEKGRLQLEIPRESQRDIVSNDSILNSTNSKNSLRAILKLSNEWLWIGLLVVLFGVLVYTGFYLITSVGDGDKMKTGLRMLLYVIIGFVIALLSWAVVSLVTSMF